jgi:hypothetical protein
VFQTVYGSTPNIAQAKSLLAQLGYWMSPGILIARDRE